MSLTAVKIEILDSSDNAVNMEVKICKALREQGKNKGTRCGFPDTGNGYCLKHEKQATLSTLNTETQQKCSRTRCNNLIPLTPGKYVYCGTCAQDKAIKRATLTLCKAPIQGGRCESKAGSTGFCGIHEKRGILLEEADKVGKRICGDGKLPCKNYTENDKSKCETCLALQREIDTTKYQERVNNLNTCLGCGEHIAVMTCGISGKEVQRCEPCYEKLRKVEAERYLRERIYKQEMKRNILTYYNNYKKSSEKRNLPFEVSLEEFTSIVNKSCTYCGYSPENEVTGIDRIDSRFGYIAGNMTPCCSTCNMMKGILSVEAFMEQVSRIVKFSISHESELFKEGSALSNALQKKPEPTPVKVTESKIKELKEPYLANLPPRDIPPPSIPAAEPPPLPEEKKEHISYIRPGEIVSHFSNGTLAKYYEDCLKDGRSPTYVERIKKAAIECKTNIEFAAILRAILQTETNREKITESGRKHMSYDDFKGYLNAGTPAFALELHESVNGKLLGFKEDLTALFAKWTDYSDAEKDRFCKKLIVKYRNQRAHGKAKVIE
jgi:hypothetical protein